MRSTFWVWDAPMRMYEAEKCESCWSEPGLDGESRRTNGKRAKRFENTLELIEASAS